MKIGYCIWSYKKDFEKTKECIQRVSPNVDCTIINYNPTRIPIIDSVDEENIKWIEKNRGEYKLHYIISEFKDNFPEQRNKYLDEARKLGMDWVAVSDNDELYSEHLASKLRSLIERADIERYNNLAVPCRDQFDAIEWLDKIDLLKECPAGYRETDFWKPLLIFKLFDDIHYEGVGLERNVHETLISRFQLVTAQLPKEYFYIHKKTALDIWRNASRNMFISGGGDNVGKRNLLWVELREFCDSIGIKKWINFEEFVNMGAKKYIGRWYILQDKEKAEKKILEFRLWLESALKAPQTKEGTETRETAKWYFALHKDEIDSRITDLINKIPELSKEIELDNYVTQCYYKTLGRHPDEIGKSNYVNAILNKRLKRSELVDVLRSSAEFKQKSKVQVELDDDIKLKYNKDEWEKVEKFVDNLYIKILNRQPDIRKEHYIKEILDSRIKPVNLVNILTNSKEYRNNTNIKGLAGFIKKRPSAIDNTNINVYRYNLKNKNISDSSQNTVALCIMGYSKGISYIEESIIIMEDKVDEIHIQGDDFTEEDVRILKQLCGDENRIKIHIEKWKDNFSDYKNRAMSHANTEWVIILDHDEIPTIEMANELKNIILSSDRGKNYDMVNFDVIDVKTINDKPISISRNSGGKALLHWNIPNPYTGNPHIWLKENYYPWNVIHSNTAYKHIKEDGTELERSVRNIFMGGGGDNSKEKNPTWVELRTFCTEQGIKTYKEFDDYLKKGHIHNDILNTIVKLSKQAWKDDELKDVLKYYYSLHPDEKDRVFFGDNISWEHHVDEIVGRSKTINEIILYEYRDDEISQHIKKYIEPIVTERGRKKLLDAGCHIGRWSKYYSDMGFDYTGIDQSKYAIETAKQYQSNNSKVKFINNFLWDMKFDENDKFDIVVSMAVLQHNRLEEQARIIPKIADALLPFGLFFMTESTVERQTHTQRTHDDWIEFIESYGFKFLESWHKNDLGFEDHYIFIKV